MFVEEAEDRITQLKGNIYYLHRTEDRLIVDDDLQIFIASGQVEASSIAEVSERKIQACGDERWKHITNFVLLHILAEALESLTVRMQIVEAKDIVPGLNEDYQYVLRGSDIVDLHIKNPNIPINHSIEKLKPHSLQRRMLGIIKWQKTGTSTGKFCTAL